MCSNEYHRWCRPCQPVEKIRTDHCRRLYKNYLLLQKNDFAYNKSATKDYPEGFIALYTGDDLAAVPATAYSLASVLKARRFARIT